MANSNPNLKIGYIEPNSDIYILNHINLNPDYEHTIYFATAEAQFTYFSSKAKFIFSKYQYQRYNRGQIKISAPVETLYDCNYMVFKNTGFSDVVTPMSGTGKIKTFYAFITDVTYINNNVTLITYEIDVMQTWITSYKNMLAPTFVIREHTANDSIGANTVPESLELGQYILENVNQTGTEYIDGLHEGTTVIPQTLVQNGEINALNSKKFGYSILFVASTRVNDPSAPPYGIMYGGNGDGNTGFYSGLRYWTYNHYYTGTQGTTEQAAAAFFSMAYSSNQIDSLVSIHMIPYFMCDEQMGTAGQVEHPAKAYGERDIEFDKNISWTYGDSTHDPVLEYGVRNNKLYTYPFNLLYVTDNMGNMAQFRYEFFSNATKCQFKLQGNTSALPEVQLVPKNYNYTTNANGELNFNEKMVISSFPQCAWNVDGFKAWLAQRGRQIVTQDIFSGLSSLASSVSRPLKSGESRISAVAGDMASAGSNLLGDIVTQLGEVTFASLLPNQAKGQQSQCLPIASGSFGFFLYHAHIRPEYAKIIDGFFDKFGYATNRIKVPNIHVRQNWTYTKTRGCMILHTGANEQAGIPQWAENMICTIFDKGITFWTDGDQVGNYNRLNPILS